MVKVPRDAPLELLGPLACGIQTGAGAVINALRVGVGQSIAVFGAGSVGLSAVMAARVVGATTIVAVDLNDTRLELARELGATQTFNPNKVDVTKAIVQATAGGVQFALDTTANAQVIRQAVESTTLRGVTGLVGASAAGTQVTFDVLHLMTAGRQIRGIVEGESVPEIFIPHLIELHKQGRFPYDRMLKFYQFDEINQAIADSESGVAIKPIIQMPRG